MNEINYNDWSIGYGNIATMDDDGQLSIKTSYYIVNNEHYERSVVRINSNVPVITDEGKTFLFTPPVKYCKLSELTIALYFEQSVKKWLGG